MSAIYVGDRVLVVAHWSSFYKYQGVVTSTDPHLMVLIDRDTYPIRMSVRECVAIVDRDGVR